MAEAKAKKADNKVKTRVPRLPGANQEQDLYVAVNGKSYIIKRGETVEVPDYVAEVIEHSAIEEDTSCKYAEKIAFSEQNIKAQ